MSKGTLTESVVDPKDIRVIEFFPNLIRLRFHDGGMVEIQSEHEEDLKVYSVVKREKNE